MSAGYYLVQFFSFLTLLLYMGIAIGVVVLVWVLLRKFIVRRTQSKVKAKHLS